MSRHRSLRLTLAASVIAVVAACSGGAPAAPALTDPVDILAQSVQTLQDVKSFRADVAVSGSVNVDAMGTGSTAAFPLDNTTAQLDVDAENKNAKATFSAPALMGVSGELIQVGGTSYVKTSLTGPLYQKSEAEAQSSYRAMQQKYPGMLGSREASIRRADLGQAGIWYRAQIGPFTTAEQATAFCDNLKAAGGQCMVHRNDVQTETVKPSERKAAEPRRATVERPRSEPTPAPRRTIVPATAPAARSISSSVSSKTTNGGNKCNTMQGRCAIYAGGSCAPSTGHWRYSCYGESCTMRYNECISRALAGRSP